MFIATFRKYWNDYAVEYERLKFNELKEIMEYVYSFHKNTFYPNISEFYCEGRSKFGGIGCLQASNCLRERNGCSGTLYLEKIVYVGNGGNEVIVFSKDEKYISPKTGKAFDEFREIAKARDANIIFGDF